VSWPVRLWLSEHVVVEGHAVDASVRGIRVVLQDPQPPGSLKVGDRYRLEVRPGRSDTFACLAEARHIGPDSVGFENLEEIPLTLILRDAAPSREPRPE
jgi:hypothetical protein